MGLIAAIKHRLERAVRRTLMSAIGGIFLAIGLGFLTSAAWIVLEDVYSAILAALILAGIYAGIGLILLGVAAASGGRDTHDSRAAPLNDPATPPKPGAMPPLAEAFIIGLNAALTMRGRDPPEREPRG